MSQPIDRVALRREIARRQLHDKSRANADLETALLLIDNAPLVRTTPDLTQIETAVRGAMTAHAQHRAENPNHTGECSALVPNAHRLADLLWRRLT